MDDRKKFREGKEINDTYAFEWQYGNILRMIPDDVYEFCYEIAKQNLVYVNKNLTEDKEFIKIQSSCSCSDYKIMLCDIKRLKNENKPFEKWQVLTRNPKSAIGLCEPYKYDLRGCPFAIAGIIHYLMMSGKEDILIQERKYYEEHKEEMDQELDKMIETRNQEIQKNKNKSLEKLKGYENKIDKFEELIFLLTNQNQKRLHCIIEGDDIEERSRIVDDIVELLKNSRDITGKKRLSLQNLTAGNTYSDNEELYYNEKDPNGVRYKSNYLIKRTILKENEIYILTDLGEFIRDYKEFLNMNIDYIHGEVRKKQYEHAIDLLTEMSHSNYIIIEATSKEADAFLELEPRLQYIYQNSRFKIPELSLDEAYSLASESKNDFGGEAISTLIKAMEDHKGEFIVIFAGYKKEMREFINMNSGIASRIGYIFDFKDYNREELAQILYKKLEKSNLTIEDKAKNKIVEIMNYFCNVENIGNGRFADKVFQEILIKHAKNMDGEISKIKEIDIPTIKEITNSLFNGDRMINPEAISEEDLRETAIHEIGHALVRYKLYNTPGIIKITINPEGRGTLGYVRHKIEEGQYVSHKSVLLNEIKVCLAGMAAEEEFIGEFSNGNSSDLENATRVAKNMITRYGMSELGFGQIEETNGAMAVKVQEEINSILSECYNDTQKIIKENKQKMKNVIDFLLKQKEITEEQFLEIFNRQ